MMLLTTTIIRLQIVVAVKMNLIMIFMGLFVQV